MIKLPSKSKINVADWQIFIHDSVLIYTINPKSLQNQRLRFAPGKLYLSTIRKCLQGTNNISQLLSGI